MTGASATPITTPRPPASAPAPPAVGRALVEHAVRAARDDRRRAGRRLLLLSAEPRWHGPPRLTVGDTPVLVVPGPTVLAVLDAVATQLPDDGETFLVVLTPASSHELGTSLLSQAIGSDLRTIDRLELVREAFGAQQLDPAFRRKGGEWLAEALMDARPEQGWPRLTGAMLDWDTAVRRLVAVRFPVGLAGADGDLASWAEAGLDAAGLLEWSRDEQAVADFVALGEAERDGLATWLTNKIGPVATAVLAAVAAGHAAQALPVGLIAGILARPEMAANPLAATTRVRVEERYLGGVTLDQGALARFGESAESLILRWRESRTHQQAAADIAERATELLAALGARELASASGLLDAGFADRLGALGVELGRALPASDATPSPADLREVEAALDRVRDHQAARQQGEALDAAVMAVRLARWLATPERLPDTVAAALLGQVRRWCWVDRALAQVWTADTRGDERLRAVYARLCAAVRARRAEFDQAFAQRLAALDGGAPGDGLLLIEEVLGRVVAPVASAAGRAVTADAGDRPAPVLIIVDGMTAGIAASLAEEIAGARWSEVGWADDGRAPALAAIPSITRVSRVSLLCGRIAVGGQREEADGFARFWGGRRKAVVLHKAEARAGAASRLGEAVTAAMRARSTLVAVVLNSVDDSLDHGREHGRGGWRVDDIAGLAELLDLAWETERPVILTSDHGHVLDRGDSAVPPSVLVDKAAARRRTGAPVDGEVLLRGPRVVLPDDPSDPSDPSDAPAAVTVPWRETIRYASRRAGYHGGASLAEMTVPVLVFVPSKTQMPKGWQRFEPRHGPEWWYGPLAASALTVGAAPSAPSAASAGKGRGRKPPQGEQLFEPAAVQPSTVGERVVRSARYQAQRAFVRRAPADEVVAALIDGLIAVGGRLPMAAAARLVKAPQVRMVGVISMISRLLNVDGYAVLDQTDEGITVRLDAALLTEQFLSESR